jgi:hypothetical protein
MVWDLGKAMRKKEEFESARLMDFEFRQRARAIKLLARELRVDEAQAIERIAEPDDTVMAWLAAESGMAVAEIGAAYARCLAQARRELIVERGDPTPYRLG